MNNTIDIKDQVKGIAEGLGIQPDIAIQLSQKCYDEVAAWKPFGGAKSFDEVESNTAASMYAMKMENETYMLRGIVENITSDSEMDTDAKTSAIQKAASDYQRRVKSIDISDENKSILDRIKSFFLEDKVIKHEGDKWVLYSHSGKRLGSFDSEAAAKKREREINFFKHQDKELDVGFKVFEDPDGNLRWLSISSNAFEDLDNELFTTKALEEAIEYADKEGERGPLLIYHVPAAVVGQCDYQALSGRFLVESGTFDDTPLGNKAVEYFVNSDEEHQVSIGFQYHEGDEEDGQYDWLRILERSVTPFGEAANPWTDFKVLGEAIMEERKAIALKKIFGDELAQVVIDTTEEKTKELEANTRFKEAAVAVTEEKPAETVTPPEEKKDAPVFGEEQVVQLANLIGTLTQELSSVSEAMAAMQEDIKQLKMTEDEKIAAAITPRWQPPVNRPSESPDTLAGDQKAVAAAVKDESDQDANPAAIYLQQLGIKLPVA